LSLGGNIGEEQVALTHFGGFVKKSAPTSGDDGEGEEDAEREGGEGRKTKKDVMSELIAKSKYYKVKGTEIFTSLLLISVTHITSSVG
jgi:hypothetical protein